MMCLCFQKSKVIETTVTAATENVGREHFVPREIFKFELADAKIPDFHPQYQPRAQQKQPQQSSNKQARRSRQRPASQAQKQESKPQVQPIEQNQPQTTKSDSSDSDLSGAGSRILQMTHPIPIYDTRQRNVKDLPFSVQKAINHALKQDFNIPYLDTIKYYFKDSAPKSSSTKLTNGSNIGLKAAHESRLNKWWQLPSHLKTPLSTSYAIDSLRGGVKLGSTTPQTSLAPVSPIQSPNGYLGYPLMRAFPVQYSLNVASDVVDGIGFLYGDRLYVKVPYSYTKNIDPVNSAVTNLKPLKDLKPTLENVEPDDTYRTTANNPTSTAPVVFPQAPPKSAITTKPPLIRYFAAEEKPNNGVALSNDKNTINLITKAVNALKKHNPHLDVVPKRIENDELIVHVTPKPEYFTTSNPLKDIATEKNLVYLKKYVEPNKNVNKETSHAYLKEIPSPINNDDLVRALKSLYLNRVSSFYFLSAA